MDMHTSIALLGYLIGLLPLLYIAPGLIACARRVPACGMLLLLNPVGGIGIRPD